MFSIAKSCQHEGGNNGPERFFYDRSSYTGSVLCGTCSRVTTSRMSALDNDDKEDVDVDCDDGSADTEPFYVLVGPLWSVCAQSRTAGVHLCGGPSIIDKALVSLIQFSAWLEDLSRFMQS